MQETWGSIPGLGRSSGGGHGNTLQYSCLENPHGQRSLGGYSPSVQFSSVAQLCLTLCNLMDCSTPGLPVRHHLPELGQVHAHQVSDAIQPSHPLSSIYVSYMNIYIYIHPCMILYAALHKCTDHPIIQSYTLLSLQRYIGYSPRPSYR